MDKTSMRMRKAVGQRVYTRESRRLDPSVDVGWPVGERQAGVEGRFNDLPLLSLGPS